MIWSTSYHHMTILVHRSWSHLLFTVASVHRRQVLLKLHRHTRSLASKPPTCPSLLQPIHQAKPHLWSSPPWSHDSMSCLMCNELLHHHIITCGLISCVSHKNTISPPKLSLNYQNQTRIFQKKTPSSIYKVIGDGESLSGVFDRRERGGHTLHGAGTRGHHCHLPSPLDLFHAATS